MPFVYNLRLLSDKYYFGNTIDLARRLKEHENGLSTYTQNYLPVEIIFNQEFETLVEARRAEVWLKKQKNRKWINRIISEGKIQKKFK